MDRRRRPADAQRPSQSRWTPEDVERFEAQRRETLARWDKPHLRLFKSVRCLNDRCRRELCTFAHGKEEHAYFGRFTFCPGSAPGRGGCQQREDCVHRHRREELTPIDEVRASFGSDSLPLPSRGDDTRREADLGRPRSASLGLDRFHDPRRGRDERRGGRPDDGDDGRDGGRREESGRLRSGSDASRARRPEGREMRDYDRSRRGRGGADCGGVARGDDRRGRSAVDDAPCRDIAPAGRGSYPGGRDDGRFQRRHSDPRDERRARRPAEVGDREPDPLRDDRRDEPQWRRSPAGAGDRAPDARRAGDDVRRRGGWDSERGGEPVGERRTHRDSDRPVARRGEDGLERRRPHGAGRARHGEATASAASPPHREPSAHPPAAAAPDAGSADWLDSPMTGRDWRQMEEHFLAAGGDQALAFKMMRDALLSPSLGMECKDMERLSSILRESPVSLAAETGEWAVCARGLPRSEVAPSGGVHTSGDASEAVERASALLLAMVNPLWQPPGAARDGEGGSSDDVTGSIHNRSGALRIEPATGTEPALVYLDVAPSGLHATSVLLDETFLGMTEPNVRAAILEQAESLLALPPPELDAQASVRHLEALRSTGAGPTSPATDGQRH